MKIHIVLSLGLFICSGSTVLGKTSVRDIEQDSNGGTKTNIGGDYGVSKKLNSNANIQAKRDISLSYAATNVNDKEGTRVKTITVIKNLNDGKNQKLAINPKLHQNEEWASAFRDNFDSYGHFPDVPDIDDLFDFVNNKENNEKKIEAETNKVAVQTTRNVKNERKEKPIVPEAKPKAEPTTPKPKIKIPERSKPLTGEEEPVEKIKGDAEIIPTNKNKKTGTGEMRSQSLGNDKSRYVEEMFNVNYSTPTHSVHQYFENYIQDPQQKGYDYQKPCVQGPITITVTTPSGRTYNVPSRNNQTGPMNPYIAPSIAKKNQINNSGQGNIVQPTPGYPVNSLVPPLMPKNIYIRQPAVVNIPGSQPIPIPSTTLQPSYGPSSQPQNPNFVSGGNFASTTQNPYIAPNLRNGLNGLSRGARPPINSIYNNGPHTFPGTGSNRPNTYRSRGLKY